MNKRRNFMQQSLLGATALTLGPMAWGKNNYQRILGANDRLGVGVIGVRSRAKAHCAAIHKSGLGEIRYNCDVDDKIMEAHNSWFETNIGKVPKAVRDFRKILDDKQVDAVFIATPEHWHAPMAIAALQAGKHVYVEKPCSHNPHENELLVAAAAKFGKVVQMGNQQRSAATSRLAIEEIRKGIIGEVYKGEAYYNNNRGSIGKGKEVAVPQWLDWELWQGPAPRQNYRDNVHPYNWHWFRAWGTGEVHNNGTHEIDICRWALGVDLPEKVFSTGGRFTYDDDWEFPDNQELIYDFGAGKSITWTGHSRGIIQPSQPGRGATIYGSKGVIELSRNFYKRYALDGSPIQFHFEKAASATTNTRGEGQLDVNHVINFFRAITHAETLNAPIADAAISTMLCHLGNMAQDAGGSLEVDPKSGKVLNNDKAMASWKREYEPGWEPKL